MSHLKLIVTSIVLFVVCADKLRADQYETPPGYYSSATGVGSTLKQQLHEIIDDHKIRSYGDARAALQVTDADLTTPNHIMLAYERESLDVFGLFASGIRGWDSGRSWNREHTWPRSLMVGSSGADNSDLHQLRPASPSVNSSRSNLNFGGEFGRQTFGRVVDSGATVWYPGDEDAGLIARQQFYMATRYDGSDFDTVDLELASGNPTTTLGNLDRMIEWHFAAPPDEFELRRNHVIYTDYQQNRNPFVDRPEYVWSVFVHQNNDSQIAIDGAAIGDDGGTIIDVDLGRVLVGAEVPTHTLSLNKDGNAGTYFEVSTSGDAFSSIGGRHNAFGMGISESFAFDVGVGGDVGTSGLRTGTVVIDNLDITTGAGMGRGANDGDDVVNVALVVLDHAQPSFSNTSQVGTLEHDFGTIRLGSESPSFDFDVVNLPGTQGFTANLEMDDFAGTGDTNILISNLAPFVGDDSLLAGLGSAFSITLDTSTAGKFSATYMLQFSDEDLPGAVRLNDLTLTLHAIVGGIEPSTDFDGDGDSDGNDIDALVNEIVTGANGGQFDLTGDGILDRDDVDQWLATAAAENGFAAAYLYGDANLDGSVNSPDLNALGRNWLANSNAWQSGDFTADGSVDASDLNQLAQNWQASLPAVATAVPEPASGICWFFLLFAFILPHAQDYLA